MIRSKIEINGKTIAVCKLEQGDETISRMMGSNMGRKKGRKSRGTYHAYSPRQPKRNEDREERLKYLLYAMVVAKQRFEAALLKARISLQELRKALGKGEK